MAVKVPDGASRSDLLWLENLDLVQIEEGFNHRIDIDSDDQFTTLKAGIKEKGVLQPLVFAKNPGNPLHPYLLRVGNRRLIACRQLRAEGWEGKIPFTLRAMDEKEALEVSFMENMERDALSPIEEANGIGKFQSFGYTNAEIAIKIHRDPVWVGTRLMLLGLHSSVKTAIHKGALPVDIGLDFARKVPLDQQEEKLAKVLGGGDPPEHEEEGPPKKKKSVRKKAAEVTGKTLRPGKKEMEVVLATVVALKDSANGVTVTSLRALEFVEKTILYANGEAEQEELEEMITELISHEE